MHEIEMNVRLMVGGILPTKQHMTDSCWDLYADWFELDNGRCTDMWLEQNCIVKVHTSVQIELPQGYGAVIRPRSGLGSKGIHVLAGEIDNGYRGEWIVCLANISKKPVLLHRGDKIAQFRLVEIPQFVSIVQVSELSETDRGSKGFGSSGK